MLFVNHRQVNINIHFVAERVHFLQVWRPIFTFDQRESFVEVSQSFAQLVGLQQGDREIIVGCELFLPRSFGSRRSNACFAEEFDGPLLVSLSLQHHPHVDIELSIRITVNVS